MNLHALRRLPVVYAVLSAARRALGRAWMRLCHGVRGVRPRRVFFSSFKGKSYSDNPRFVSEALRALRPDIEIVWQLSRDADRTDLPDYVRTVPPHSPAALAMIATARCIVDNFNRPIYLIKFPDQLYVQTWHGDRGFKKILCDMDGAPDYPDGRQMDLAVAGSDHAVRLYRSAFRYDGPVLLEGSPRNDPLVRRDLSRGRAAQERLGIAPDVRIALYAPTFRDATSGKAQWAGFDVDRAVAALERGTGARWICLVRAHDQNRGIAGGGRDVTAYPEMADLLLAADLLITDYSSSAGDFPLLERPVVLYQPDLKDFMGSDRQMYYDLTATPFARAESEDALCRLLEDFDRLPRDSAPICRFFGIHESGRAAEAVAEWISERVAR